MGEKIFGISVGILYTAYVAVRLRAELSAASRRRAQEAPEELCREKRDGRELTALTAVELAVLAAWYVRWRPLYDLGPFYRIQRASRAWRWGPRE